MPEVARHPRAGADHAALDAGLQIADLRAVEDDRVLDLDAVELDTGPDRRVRADVGVGDPGARADRHRAANHAGPDLGGGVQGHRPLDLGVEDALPVVSRATAARASGGSPRAARRRRPGTACRRRPPEPRSAHRRRAAAASTSSSAAPVLAQPLVDVRADDVAGRAVCRLRCPGHRMRASSSWSAKSSPSADSRSRSRTSPCWTTTGAAPTNDATDEQASTFEVPWYSRWVSSSPQSDPSPTAPRMHAPVARSVTIAASLTPAPCERVEVVEQHRPVGHRGELTRRDAHARPRRRTPALPREHHGLGDLHGDPTAERNPVHPSRRMKYG